MKILIEDHKYDNADIESVLHGYKILDNPIHHVGYFFSKELNDCVFFLPKVIMDEKNLVFGKYRPEDIIDIDKLYGNNVLEKEERDFLYNFSVWIYRTIDVFRKQNPDNTIVKRKAISEIGNSGSDVCSTILDVIIALIKFNNENRNFFLFTIKDIHSGYNKINWNRTIGTKQPILQNGAPLYLKPVNKKKQISYDEELFIIFFSILKYVNSKYGFNAPINLSYELIPDGEFENYLRGYGLVKLRQIKYKYFADKLLKLWNLCYLFFELSSDVYSSSQSEDYLMVGNFNIVFERIIDDLISDTDIPKPLKEQGDGKIVDHIYRYQSVVNEDSMYYIGDSKYYKIGHDVSGNSEYKQYTYAKNVIQFNLDLFIDINNEKKTKYNPLPYRDEKTEGYNITPNFFISAEINQEFDYSNDYLNHRDGNDTSQIQFENRLFDRDTLWLSHYDINFLFVIAKYVTSNDFTKGEYREEVRRKFRSEVIKLLDTKYTFYILVLKEGLDFQNEIDRLFRYINGKVYCPSQARSCNHLIMALDKRKKFSKENDLLITRLNSSFDILEGYHVGESVERFIDKRITKS